MSALFRNIKNSIDFPLRNLFRWGYPVRKNQVSKLEYGFQAELSEFLDLLPWPKLLAKLTTRLNLKILEVGTRNFASGPVIEKKFQTLKVSTQIYGIEIDAYRRLANFHVRADYGKYFAKQMKNGFFYAMDFLNWNEKADIIFLLNPFVTCEPLLHWGLPRKHFKPLAIFEKVKAVLNPQGFVVLSCPNEEELEESKSLAKKAGLSSELPIRWKATESTIHKKDRLGIILRAS